MSLYTGQLLAFKYDALHIITGAITATVRYHKPTLTMLNCHSVCFAMLYSWGEARLAVRIQMGMDEVGTVPNRKARAFVAHVIATALLLTVQLAAQKAFLGYAFLHPGAACGIALFNLAVNIYAVHTHARAAEHGARLQKEPNTSRRRA